jgi:hypothetical protein
VFYDPRGIPAPERPPEAPAVMEVGLGEAGSSVAEVGLAAPAGAAPPDATDALIRANRSRGINPSWDTPSCRWRRLDDVPLELLRRAEEAA